MNLHDLKVLIIEAIRRHYDDGVCRHIDEVLRALDHIDDDTNVIHVKVYSDEENSGELFFIEDDFDNGPFVLVDPPYSNNSMAWEFYNPKWATDAYRKQVKAFFRRECDYLPEELAH